MMATAINKPKRRPTYPELAEMIVACGGNLSHVGAECGYHTRSVQMWIQDAHEVTRLGLIEAIAKGKAKAAADKLTALKAQRLKKSVPAFVIPAEIKALISLYYRLSDAELNQIEIDQVLSLYDTDPEKPSALRYKITWAELGQVLAGIEALTINVEGRHIHRWYLHVLMHWVGIGSESPVFDDYDYLPEIMIPATQQKPAEVKLVYIEPIVRLIIKRLSKYL